MSAFLTITFNSSQLTLFWFFLNQRGEVKFKFSIAKAEVKSADDIIDEETSETLKTWAITLLEGGEYVFATTDEDRAAWIQFTSEALQLTLRLVSFYLEKSVKGWFE